MSDSAAAVVGTVTNVSAPRWNSPDGRQWAETKGLAGAPHRYRTATLRIESVIYGDLKAGSSLPLLLAGAGAPAPVADPAIGRDYAAPLTSGRATTGDQIVIVLYQGYFVFSDGNKLRGWMPKDNLYGLWVIDGDRAVSLDPDRSTTVTALVSALSTERALGRRPDRDGDLSNAPFRPSTTSTTIVRPPPSVSVVDPGPLQRLAGVTVGDGVSVEVTENRVEYLVRAVSGSTQLSAYGIAKNYFDTRAPVPDVGCLQLPTGGALVTVGTRSHFTVSTAAAVGAAQTFSAGGLTVIVQRVDRTQAVDVQLTVGADSYAMARNCVE